MREHTYPYRYGNTGTVSFHPSLSRRYTHTSIPVMSLLERSLSRSFHPSLLNPSHVRCYMLSSRLPCSPLLMQASNRVTVLPNFSSALFSVDCVEVFFISLSLIRLLLQSWKQMSLARAKLSHPCVQPSITRTSHALSRCLLLVPLCCHSFHPLYSNKL